MSQTETRHHKIKCDYGITHYRRYYKKNAKDPVSDRLFGLIFKEYLSENRELVATTGYIFVMPQRMGRVEMRKSKAEVKIDKDGNVVNKLPVNWKETRKLWKENPKAYEKKIFIRHTNEHTGGYVFRPRYMKNNANYKNKTIYKLQINRDMSRASYKPIMEGRLDAFLLNPEYDV